MTGPCAGWIKTFFNTRDVDDAVLETGVIDGVTVVSKRRTKP